MWDASLVSLPMFADGIATKWASHIHRGLTVYSEQSLFPHLFIIVLTYHALSPFSLQHEFIYHILLLLTLIYQSRCKGKKVHAISVATTRKLLLSSLQHQTHSYHKLQVVPRTSKASFSCCCWKQSFCSSCSSSISWSLPNGFMSNSSSLSGEIWGSDKRNHLEWSRSKRYFVNFELNWVQLLTPFNE